MQTTETDACGKAILITTNLEKALELSNFSKGVLKMLIECNFK